MGYYINPPSGTKEQWLGKHAILISETEAKRHTAGDTLVVCLVDNGPFTAAAIAYDDLERDAFTRDDGRHKCWYLADKAALVRDRFLNGI